MMMLVLGLRQPWVIEANSVDWIGMIRVLGRGSYVQRKETKSVFGFFKTCGVYLESNETIWVFL